MDINTAKERFHNARQGLRTRDSTFQRPIAGRNRLIAMNRTEGKLSNDKVTLGRLASHFSKENSDC